MNLGADVDFLTFEKTKVRTWEKTPPEKPKAPPLSVQTPQRAVDESYKRRKKKLFTQGTDPHLQYKVALV